jgi:hypothetical protein
MIQIQNIDVAYKLIILILGFGFIIKCLELIRTSSTFKPKEAFDWQVVGRDKLLNHRFSGFFGVLYSRSGVITICLVSILSYAGFVIYWENELVTKIAMSALLLACAIIYQRQGYGADGADQMTFLVLLSTFLCYVLVDNEAVKLVGISFIAMQLVLSYIISGGAKLISTQWRSGTAIVGILSTYTYGTEITRRVFRKNNFFSKTVCWFTILIECLFPLILFLDGAAFDIAIAVGILFHLSIAIVMGLNDFVFSFTAAYVGLIFFHQYFL